MMAKQKRCALRQRLAVLLEWIGSLRAIQVGAALTVSALVGAAVSLAGADTLFASVTAGAAFGFGFVHSRNVGDKMWPQVRYAGLQIGDTIAVVSWSGQRSSKIVLGGAIREIELDENEIAGPGQFTIRAIRNGRLVVGNNDAGCEGLEPLRRRS